MNEQDEAICKFIFSKLMQSSLVQIFWETPVDVSSPGNTHPISLSQIHYKLEHKLYKSSVLFLKNIRMFIDNSIDVSQPGTLRYAAALQIKIDFEKILASLDSPLYNTTLALLSSCEEYEESGTIPERKTIETENAGKKLGTRYFLASSHQETDYNKLLKDIKICYTSGLATRVAAFIKRLQPDKVVVGQSIYLMTKNLSNEDVQKLQEYITKLLQEVAAGRIDPYNRPFGQKISPVDVKIHD